VGLGYSNVTPLGLVLRMMWGWDTVISPRWGFVEGDVGLGYNNVGSLGLVLLMMWGWVGIQ